MRSRRIGYVVGLVMVMQGCHCWGWYHYHNCYVYLGAPPGAKTYGYGYWAGWPYATSPPTPLWPGQYALYPQITAEPLGPSTPSYETAPMPRLDGELRKHPEDKPHDLLIPPPRKVPQDEAIPPPPLPPKGQAPPPDAARQALQLQLRGPLEINLTQTASLQITISNSTAANLEDVELVLHLPKVVQVMSMTPTGQIRGQEITWTFAQLQPGAVQTLTVHLRAQRTANSAVCHVTALSRDGTGAASSHALRIVPGQ